MVTTQEKRTKPSVKTKNIWYVLGIKDENHKFRFSNAEAKGLYYETLEEAIERKDWLENMRDERIYILERTCEVIL